SGLFIHADDVRLFAGRQSIHGVFTPKPCIALSRLRGPPINCEMISRLIDRAAWQLLLCGPFFVGARLLRN
ncbi:hypothetical protein NL533_34855, partial [Klebsiella pneumoniae]|nr:hypothetical protein [Klebsiella pneumoniae]